MNAAIDRVDELAARGDLAGAAQELEQLLAQQPAALGNWLKLAGLRRALRQPRRALEAVHRALALSPLDFMALVMRAQLLERSGDPGANAAWHEALAQEPEGDLPPPLAAAVAHGRELRDQWLAERDLALRTASRTILADAEEDEAWRVARFRDNILRKTRVYRSEPTHFHFPGLPEREFYPRKLFPQLAQLEAEAPAIGEELLSLLNSDRAELVPYLDYDEHEALAQWRDLNRNPDWTAIHLLQKGRRVDSNADQCPRTMMALSRFDQPSITGASPNAMFSLLAPGKRIPPHVGVNNTRLLCHLPLIVPEGCWFRVGAERRFWQRHEAFVFDDTVEHEAENPSRELRIVLIFDLWHPDLTLRERQAVAAMIGIDAPENGASGDQAK